MPALLTNIGYHFYPADPKKTDISALANRTLAQLRDTLVHGDIPSNVHYISEYENGEQKFAKTKFAVFSMQSFHSLKHGEARISPSPDLEPYMALHAMAAGPRSDDLALIEKAAQAVCDFKQEQWSGFALPEFGTHNGCALLHYANDVMDSGDQEKEACFQLNTGLRAAEFHEVYTMASAAIEHFNAFDCWPSEAAERYQKDAKTLGDLFLSDLHLIGGRAQVCMNLETDSWHPVNEDDYMTTVYISAPENFSHAALDENSIIKWCRHQPESFRLAKGGIDASLEETLIGNYYSEKQLDDGLRLYTRSGSDTVVIACKLPNYTADKVLSTYQQRLLQQMDYIHGSDLPVWLQPVPDYEISDVIDAIEHKLPESVRAMLYDENGEIQVTGAMVLIEDGDYSDVFVTDASNTFSANCQYFPILINDQAQPVAQVEQSAELSI